jgi:aminoglycoside phosphotransferase (APT) family kinase protein
VDFESTAAYSRQHMGGHSSPIFFPLPSKDGSGNAARQRDVDPALILAAFGLTGATAIALVRQGVTKTIWRVEISGQTFAMHVFHPDQLTSFQGELWAMDRAAHGGIPVPALHAHGMWQDHPVMISVWCAGDPLLSALRTRPWTIRAAGSMLGAMHAHIHRLHAPRLEVQPDGWIDQLAPVPARLRERLCALPLRSDALLHFDYHLENVMAHNKRVTAVLDWQKACPGDPRADIAQSVIGLLFSPEKSTPPLLHAAARSLLTRWYLRSYQQVSGPLGDMALFYTWAGTVQASIYGNLEHKTDQSAADLERRYLRPLRKWTERWSHEAGFTS